MNTLQEKIFTNITGDFNALTKVVAKQLSLTVRLLEDNRNEEIHAEIQHNERLIDSMEIKIRDEVIHAIVLYTPRASHLRKIISYYDMTAYLERIGDLLLNIAGFLKQIAIDGTIFADYKTDLSNMFSIAQNMTQNAIFAFICEDNHLAQETIETDHSVDDLHHHINECLQKRCAGKALTTQQVTDIIFISNMAYNIERIGDNATNIAEAAIYLMEGKNIKHCSTQLPTLHAGSEGEQFPATSE